MADAITIRVSRPDDIPTLARTGLRAFRLGTLEGWTSYFTESPHAPADATLVAEIDGKIAGNATALELTMSLAGVDVPMRGIAAVAVSPEFRRRGVADALMHAHLRRMKKRGQALSLLYPFKQPFYRKFGYGTVEWLDHLRAPPSMLPASPLRRNVREFDAERDAAPVKALYERLRAGTTGQLQRSDYWWTKRVWNRAPEGVVYVDPATKAITGVLHYAVPATPEYPRQHVHVRDLHVATPDAFRGLVGFLEALGEQTALVQLPLARGAGAALLLDKPFDVMPGAPAGILEPAAYISVGAMARLVDVPAAFALHPCPARYYQRFKLGLDLTDPVFPSRSFDVTVNSKGARVVPGAAARDRLSLSVDRLAQIYFAAAPAGLLLQQGLITGSDRAGVLLDCIFTGPSPYLGPGNFF